MDSLTLVYARMHDAFAVVAEYSGLTPFEVRVCVAIDDLGGSARSDEIEQAVHDTSGGSSVRRALLTLYQTNVAEGKGPDGGRRKRGHRTVVTLTPLGRQAVQLVRTSLNDLVLKAA